MADGESSGRLPAAPHEGVRVIDLVAGPMAEASRTWCAWNPRRRGRSPTKPRGCGWLTQFSATRDQAGGVAKSTASPLNHDVESATGFSGSSPNDLSRTVPHATAAPQVSNRSMPSSIQLNR